MVSFVDSCFFSVEIQPEQQNIVPHHHHVPCQMPQTYMALHRSWSLVFLINSYNGIPQCHSIISLGMSLLLLLLIFPVIKMFSHYMTNERCLSFSNSCVQCSTIINHFQASLLVTLAVHDIHNIHLRNHISIISKLLLICSFTFHD